MASEQRTVEGSVLGGPDGSVYFIPTSRLDEFKLSQEQASQVRDLMGTESEVEGHSFTTSQYSFLGYFIFNPGSSISGSDPVGVTISNP